MKQIETVLLCEKAKVRKDGVYSYNGYLYLVKDNHLHSIADYDGTIYYFFGSFFVEAGKVARYDRKKSLLEILK